MKTTDVDTLNDTQAVGVTEAHAHADDTAETDAAVTVAAAAVAVMRPVSVLLLNKLALPWGDADAQRLAAALADATLAVAAAVLDDESDNDELAAALGVETALLLGSRDVEGLNDARDENVDVRVDVMDAAGVGKLVHVPDCDVVAVNVLHCVRVAEPVEDKLGRDDAEPVVVGDGGSVGPERVGDDDTVKVGVAVTLADAVDDSVAAERDADGVDVVRGEREDDALCDMDVVAEGDREDVAVVDGDRVMLAEEENDERAVLDAVPVAGALPVRDSRGETLPEGETLELREPLADEEGLLLMDGVLLVVAVTL